MLRGRRRCAFFIMLSDLCQTTTFYLPYHHHHHRGWSGIPQSMCHCRSEVEEAKKATREASQIQFEEKLKRRVGNCMNSRNSKLIVKAHKNFNFMVFGGAFDSGEFCCSIQCYLLMMLSVFWVSMKLIFGFERKTNCRNILLKELCHMFSSMSFC